MTKTISCSLLLLAAALQHPTSAQTAQSTWVRASDDLKNYCISGVCLGMTRDEVAAKVASISDLTSDQRGHTLKEGEGASPFRERNTKNEAVSLGGSPPAMCHPTFGFYYSFRTRLKDGSSLFVGFTNWPGTEPAVKRYRVNMVQFVDEMDKKDAASIEQQLAEKYGLKKGASKKSFDAAKDLASGLTVSASARDGLGYYKPILRMVDDNALFKDWMIQANPACAPKIPKI